VTLSRSVNSRSESCRAALASGFPFNAIISCPNCATVTRFAAKAEAAVPASSENSAKLRIAALPEITRTTLVRPQIRCKGWCVHISMPTDEETPIENATHLQRLDEWGLFRLEDVKKLKLLIYQAFVFDRKCTPGSQ
jgi:hypothetical protein